MQKSVGWPARGKLVAGCELAPLCWTLRVCLDGISAVKHGSLMWGQASQALGTNPEGDYSPTEQLYTTGSMPSVQPPFHPPLHLHFSTPAELSGLK